MNALRRHLPLLSWIALMAIAALALLPTVSHALAFSQGSSPYVEICTAQGARLVAMTGQADTEAPAAGAVHLQHCPLCALSLDAQPLPVAPVTLRLPLASAAPPPLFLHAPYTLQAWRSAPARGPPAHS